MQAHSGNVLTCSVVLIVYLMQVATAIIYQVLLITWILPVWPLLLNIAVPVRSVASFQTGLQISTRAQIVQNPFSEVLSQ